MKQAYQMFFLGLSLISLFVGISSCSFPQNKKTENTSASKKAEKQLVIGASLCTTQTPYLSSVSKIMETTARNNGVILQLESANWNVETQKQQLEAFLKQGVDAIIVTPVNLKSLADTLSKIKDNNIPIINLNMKVDMLSTEYITSYVGANNTEEGVLSAKLFLQAFGSKGGNIAIIEGAQGNDPTIYRTQSFITELKTHPEITIVDLINGNWTRKGARLATFDLLKKYPDIDGIYCHDSEMAMGVIQALKEKKSEHHITITGIDGQQEYYQAIQNGELYGLITQPREYEATMSIFNAIQATKGSSLKAWYKDPLTVVTKENVDTFL